MDELLNLLNGRLSFFLDPRGYAIIGSRGSAHGDAFIDMRRDGLIWRLARDRGQVSLELRFDETRAHPAYSTDILKRWLTGAREDGAALLSDDLAQWLEHHLVDIEEALVNERSETVAQWDELKRRRAVELFG